MTATYDVQQDGISLVVLAKDSREAKTRLPLAPADRRELALHLAARTVRVGLEALSVGAVLVVTSDPDISGDALAAGALVVAERRPRGMDRATTLGRRRALALRPLVPVAVVVADLPDLVAADLDAAVGEFIAIGAPMFVPDHDGTGTTFVVHGPGRWPGVAFGKGSAAAHEALGYHRSAQSPWPLRHDLDTADDLVAHDIPAPILRRLP